MPWCLGSDAVISFVFPTLISHKSSFPVHKPNVHQLEARKKRLYLPKSDKPNSRQAALIYLIGELTCWSVHAEKGSNPEHTHPKCCRSLQRTELARILESLDYASIVLYNVIQSLHITLTAKGSLTSSLSVCFFLSWKLNIPGKGPFILKICWLNHLLNRKERKQVAQATGSRFLGQFLKAA